MDRAGLPGYPGLATPPLAGVLSAALRAPRRISQQEATRALGAGLILWVDPRAITHSVTRLEKYLRSRDEGLLHLPAGTLKHPISHYARGVPFVLRDQLYPSPKALSENGSKGFMESLVKLRETPEESTWWKHYLAQIEASGVVMLKGRTLTSADDLRRHLRDYLLPIVDGLVAKGWDSDAAGPEIGAASIGPGGELFKSESVNHRFFLARALGVRPFPLRVRSVHRDWWKETVHSASRATWPTVVRDALRGVEAAHRENRSSAT